MASNSIDGAKDDALAAAGVPRSIILAAASKASPKSSEPQLVTAEERKLLKEVDRLNLEGGDREEH